MFKSRLFLFNTFVVLVWTPQNTMADHPSTRIDCSTQPLDPLKDTTLCGNTNATRLQCYRDRVRCNVNGIGHWTSVCLFIPSENKEIGDDFLDNYNKNYDCEVMGDFGSVNCTSRNNTRFHFVSTCNFTFYYCSNDPLICLNQFPTELEDGGRCPPPKGMCPASNLFSLTNSFLCTPPSFIVPPINYTDLRKLVIRPPTRCIDRSTTTYAILFAILSIILVIAVGTFLLCKYRKLKAGVRAEMSDDAVIKMGERVLAGYDMFLEMHQNVDNKESVDPYTPNKHYHNNGKPSSTDTGFHDSLIDDYANQLEDVSPESKALISDSPDTVMFLANPTYVHDSQRENTTPLQDDDETSEFELRTYSLKKKNDDSDMQVPPTVFAPTEEDKFIPPTYPQHNENLSTEFPGYLHKHVSDFHGSSPDIISSSAIPNYLRKTDLSDT